jgi:hypothetical protein
VNVMVLVRIMQGRPQGWNKLKRLGSNQGAQVLDRMFADS